VPGVVVVVVVVVVKVVAATVVGAAVERVEGVFVVANNLQQLPT
jgi:hypothetical protein